MCNEYINLKTKEVLDLEKVKSLKSNAMLVHYPHLWEIWDFELNKDFDIYKITMGSGHKVFWYCDVCKDSHDVQVYSKKNGYGCSYCTGKKVNHINSLNNASASLSLEWNYEKNDKTPKNVNKNSNVKYWWKCKYGHEWQASVDNRFIHGNGCPYCNNGLICDENRLSTNYPKLSKQWNYEKNTKIPCDITYKSIEKVWWKCELCHEWESSVWNRVCGTGCPYCSNKSVLKGFNDMWTTAPELASLLANPEDGYKYTRNTNTKLLFTCKACNEELGFRAVNSFVKNSMTCCKCSPVKSYGERFIIALLKILKVEFEAEKTFSWSNRKRYDFYIPSLNMIIETHGGQHYKETSRGRSLKEEQENDEYKHKIAIDNGIDNYIIINSSSGDGNVIFEVVSNSELSKFLNIESVDRNYLITSCEKSMILSSWESSNQGLNVKEISEELSISERTVNRYLSRKTN